MNVDHETLATAAYREVYGISREPTDHGLVSANCVSGFYSYAGIDLKVRSMPARRSMIFSLGGAVPTGCSVASPAF